MMVTRTGFCQLCTNPTQGTDLHHIAYRSAGGSDDASNLIEICRRCHDNIHRGDWQIATTPDGTYVLQNYKAISVRYRPPAGFDQGAFVKSLDAAPGILEAQAAWFRYLDDDGLVAAGQALYKLHYTGWVVRARLFETEIGRAHV